jgi:hypothetical protein
MGKKRLTEKEEVRGRGERLNRGVVKSEIIKYILKEHAAVSEPHIREYLNTKHKVKFASGIKLHLKELHDDKFDYKCIQKIPCKNGFANSWDIKTVEQLINIKTHFKDINLSEYPKSVNIIGEKYRRNFLPLEFAVLRTQLRSASFFDTCLYINPETIYKQTMRNFRNSKEGLELTAEIKKDINILLALYREHNPDTNISDDIFLEISGKKSRVLLGEIVDYLSEETVIDFMSPIYNVFNFLQMEYFWSFSLISENHIINDISTLTLSTEKIEHMLAAKKCLIFFRDELKDELANNQSLNMANKSKYDLFSNYLAFMQNILKDSPEDTTYEFYGDLSDEYEKNIGFVNEYRKTFNESHKLMDELIKLDMPTEEFKIKLLILVKDHHLKCLKSLKNLLLN